MTLDVDIGHRLGDFVMEARFRVDEPGITALFGPSGAGKSSIVSAIAGLLRPASGRIAINGETVFDSVRRLDVPARRRRVGYVFQDARLFPHLDVRRNLDFGARRAAEPPAPDYFDHVVELLGLGDLLRRRTQGLSGGERQRVALGRALLSGPRLLLLDEPLAALDQGLKNEILPLLERLRDEALVPMVYVSHSLDEVTRLADRMVVLNRGRVAADGPVYEIMSRLDLFPLTGRFEAGAVVAGLIAAHDEADQLSAVDLDRGRLWVPRIDLPVGAPVRLRIRARDVMLATVPPEGISANNVLTGEIAEIRADRGPYLDVQVACGKTRLIARITHRSCRRLGLEVGLPVHAVIKSVTVDRRGGNPGGRD